MPSTDLEPALASLAPRLDVTATGIAGLQRLSGGATQEIWRFDLVGGTAAPLILRRGSPGAAPGPTIGLVAEAALMAAAATAGVPVPRIRRVLAPGDELGQGFVMDFVPGETLGGRIVKGEAARPVGLARQCGTVLAGIHAIDPATLPALERLSPAALVDQWRAAYRATAWPRPVFEVALRWLDAHCPPPPPRPALVHGDFRNGNLMVDDAGIAAVLDWELAHVGDPLEDLGWLCVASWRFGRIDRPVGGFGARAELLDGYAAAGGARFDESALAWWEVFGTLRWGVMCASMTAAFRGGDPSVERALIARRASETEIDLLRLLGLA